MRALLALILCLLAMPVLAEEKLVLATCGEKGCVCALSSITVDEATVVLGIDPPPPGEGEVKLVEYNGQVMWSRLPLRDINILAGGNDECPLRLLPDKVVVPLDGSWVGTATPISSQGCPPGLDALLTPILKGIIIPRQMAWGGSFNPDKMRDQSSEQAVRWSKVTPRSFKGEVANLPAASAAAKISVDFQATLVSLKSIRGVIRLRLKSKGGSGASKVLEMAGIANCLSVTRYDFRRTGP
ncbi:hypothetical protein [Pararhizobium antarcticum]|uniref:Uncharacterized protein n=1 Tax=Pararhizobium antarcticum TaxID=1798805 RepID=A0A657LWM9_9HYPH|nr:hypothetical protein [Pararhizobium antarcticum]OJF98215.1 hypothetical protein AX761_12750 [Rhizobium sp. 58]OJF99206.1 hypothetical protein AX760_13380 [Pararhizobium antarcticum]